MATIYDYNQFITYRLSWDETKQKHLKQPFDITAGPSGEFNRGYHAGQGWMSYSDACTVAEQNGLGVGFVFTANDPFFFVDIDNCAEGGDWSPFAKQVMGMFPGAMIEVSVSGTGLHIIGHGQAPIGHRNRDDARGLEVYTQLRFVALGKSAIGDSGTEHTAALNALLATMPNGGVSPLKDMKWTTEPDPEWSGPLNDDELIKMMLESRPSAKAAFDMKCTIKQLWERDEEALRKHFPDTGERGFDWSSADAALISHLAWWTGKNCERMDRLFRRSALYREDKWGNRPDYIQRTIGGANALCHSVLKAGGGQETTEEGKTIPKLGTLWADQQEDYFKGCVYVRSQHKVFVPDTGELITEAQFKASYGGYEFIMDGENKKSKNAFECFTMSRLFRFPKAHKPCFRPETGSGNIIKQGTLALVNTYVPAQVEVGYGDVGPMMDLLQRLLPDERDREILISYMAAIVQNPGAKFQWTPLLQGVPGNGKSFFIRALSHAVGEQYVHLVNPEKDFTSQFTDWINRKLFIGVEEIYVHDRREVMDALKPMITNDRMGAEGKGTNQETIDNRANFFCCSNHKDAILLVMSDRRWAVFYTAQQTLEDLARDGMTGSYFPDLYAWARREGYANIAGFLKNYQIKDEFNPVTECHRAPTTSSTDEAVSLSLGPLEQEVLEAIEAGSYAGMRGGWISSEALNQFFINKLKRNVSVKKRYEIVTNLGYIKHPALKDGRVGTPLLTEGNTRPILYVKKDNLPIVALTDPNVIRNVYCQQQGYAEVPTQPTVLTHPGATGTN